MVSNCHQALPSRDGIRPDDGVSGCQIFANVLRRTAGLVVDCEILLLGGFGIAGLRVDGGQGLKESLVRLGNAVKKFVTGGPESIYKETK